MNLPSAASILFAQSGQTVGTYTLENLELGYETIDNADIASEVSGAYGTGSSISYEHATRMKTVEWDN